MGRKKQQVRKVTTLDYSRQNAVYTHRRKKKLPIVLAIVFVLVLAGAGAAFAYIHNLNSKIQIEDEEVTESLTEVKENVEPYWTLILGSDARPEESESNSRSDVIMLVRVDQNNKQLTLVSIPRDTLVDIEGYGTNKINAAYSYGGAQLAISTIEEFAGVKISHYAEIYFDGVETLVDSIGGITVDVPEYASYADVTLDPGVQTLTGHEAMILARVRKTYSQGDFTRTYVQRLLVQAMVEKVLSQPVTSLPSIVESIAGCFTTDMSLNDLIALAQAMQGITSENMYSAMAPSTAGMVDGVSYTFTYINQWKLLMQKADEGVDPTLSDEEIAICGTESTETTDLVMTTGLPDTVKTQLEELASQQAAAAAAAAAGTDGTATDATGTSSSTSATTQTSQTAPVSQSE